LPAQVTFMRYNNRSFASRHRLVRAVAFASAAALLGLPGASWGAAEAPPIQMPAATQPAGLPPFLARGLDANGTIALTAGQNRLVTTSVPLKTVDVSDPELMGVNLISPTEVLLTARHTGSAQLMLWDDNGRTITADILVEPDLRTIRAELAKDFHDLKVQVSAANGAVVLSGRVPSAEMAEKIVQVATPFAAKVINLLEIGGGQQVTLQVRELRHHEQQRIWGERDRGRRAFEHCRANHQPSSDAFDRSPGQQRDGLRAVHGRQDAVRPVCQRADRKQSDAHLGRAEPDGDER
jgi:Flp pilus assembly secretin CpaC